MIQPSPFNSSGFILMVIRGSKENIPLILISIATNLQSLQNPYNIILTPACWHKSWLKRVLHCLFAPKLIKNIFLVKSHFGFYVLFILWVESKLLAHVAELQFPGFKHQPLSLPGGAPPMALAKRIKFNLKCHFSGVHLCHVHTLKFRVQKVYRENRRGL